MTQRHKMTMLAAALVFPLSGGHAAEPLQPLKPWTVDYGETACSALTTYGSAEAPITLGLKLSPHGKAVQMMVLRQGRAQEPKYFPATIGFADQTLGTTALRYSTADRKVQVLSLTVARDAIDPLRNASNVNVAVNGQIEQSFALPRIQSVFRQLDHCQADLQKHWNISEAVSSTFKTKAVPMKSLASYVSSDDYPTQALQDQDAGRTSVTLMVDADGRLKQCMVEETSGVASLDAMTCIVLMRARFRPATDANGRPVRSVLTQAMTWGMADWRGRAPSHSAPERPSNSGQGSTER